MSINFSEDSMAALTDLMLSISLASTLAVAGFLYRKITLEQNEKKRIERERDQMKADLEKLNGKAKPPTQGNI